MFARSESFLAVAKADLNLMKTFKVMNENSVS